MCLVDNDDLVEILTFNSVIAPVMILLSKPNNQTFKLLIDPWSATATF